jgi:hypothetical protein
MSGPRARARVSVETLVDELGAQLPEDLRDMAETFVLEELEALVEAQLVEHFGSEDVLLLTLAQNDANTLRDWLRRHVDEAQS